MRELGSQYALYKSLQYVATAPFEVNFSGLTFAQYIQITNINTEILKQNL